MRVGGSLENRVSVRFFSSIPYRYDGHTFTVYKQEPLDNVLKHAHATTVSVTIHLGSEIMSR